jgi:hypothetical protein
VVATQIVQALVGSIGLVASVPITTALAVWVHDYPRPRAASLERTAPAQALARRRHSGTSGTPTPASRRLGPGVTGVEGAEPGFGGSGGR